MCSSIKSCLVAVLLISPTLSTAQEKPEIIKTELLTLCFNGFVPGYYYRNGKEVLQLTASAQGISPPIHYVGPKVLALYEKKSDLEKVPEGQTPPKPLLVTTIPDGSDRVLLMFAFGDKKKPPSLRTYGVNDSKLKEGDYRVFNFTKKKIFVMLKDKKSRLTLSSGKQGTIDSAAWGKKVQSIDAWLGSQNGDKVSRDYASVWGHRPERRSFIFVFDSQDKNRPLDIRKFYDVPSYKAPKLPAGPGELEPGSF